MLCLKGEKVPFIVDEKNNTLKIRRGDSGSIIFKFNIPLEGFRASLHIAKNNTAEPLISKTYNNIKNNILEVNLTADETNKLSTDEGFMGEYCLYLKLHNSEGFSAVIVPNNFTNQPKLLVYPKIGAQNNG